MTCGKCEDKGKRLSFRQPAKSGLEEFWPRNFAGRSAAKHNLVRRRRRRQKGGKLRRKSWSVVLGRLREESRSHLGSWINECKQDRMVYKADVQSFIELAGQLEA